MKYRSGFVSNSSSSSFVIFYDYVDFDKWDDYDKMKYPIWGLSHDAYGEGNDFFEVDNEIAEFLSEKIKKIKKEKHGYLPMEFYNVYGMISIEDHCNKKELSDLIATLPEKFEVKTVAKSWNGTEDLRDMIDRYFPKDKNKVKDYED